MMDSFKIPSLLKRLVIATLLFAGISLLSPQFVENTNADHCAAHAAGAAASSCQAVGDDDGNPNNCSTENGVAFCDPTPESTGDFSGTPGSDPGSCGDSLFGLIPPWHKGLCEGDDVQDITELDQLLVIGFNVVEMLLGVMVIAAVIFFIVGTIRMIASSGKPEGIAAASKTISNSVIGLAIGLTAGSIVSYLSKTANEIVVQGEGEQDISEIIELLIRVGASVAIIFIVKAAVQYTASEGDSGKIASAKNTILYVVIGLVLLVSSYTIISVIVGSL